MYFQQFYLSCLSQASYVLASGGVAAVVDPQRDVDLYIEEARANGFRIQYIIETSLRADFVSGRFELARRSGAQIYLSANAKTSFPFVPARDGGILQFGQCRLEFLETPGHTPESICVLVTDLAIASKPFAVLTGGTLFIGDVGRPDLSDDATPLQLAGLLYDSLHGKLMTLDDSVAVYPAYGAGSLCGRQISAERSSTIGKERSCNYALRPSAREEFVKLMTPELPERPESPDQVAPVPTLPPLPGLNAQELLARQAAGAVILDARPVQDFLSAHVPGSIPIGPGGQFAAAAVTAARIGPEVVLIVDDSEELSVAQPRLTRAGIQHAAGYLAEGFTAWVRAGLPVKMVAQVSAEDLYRRLPGEHGLQLVDVRRPAEWEQGHLPGSTLIPLNRLLTDLDSLGRDRPVVVHCKSGDGGAIAAGILQRAGFEQVMNLMGGFDAWRACRLPEEISQPFSYNV